MIIAEEVKDVEILGEDTSKKAKISQDKLAKLQYLLTKGLYKDPITAVIAEWTNNGIDSVVQAGKSPIDNPVIVSIYKNEKEQIIFRVEDRGIGLDDKDFEDICMNYLESTKEEDNNTIGHFGIGMKSFLSLERSATFTCRRDGLERKYLVYEGAEFVNFTLVHEKKTKEENGVISELVINGWSEKSQFVDKAKTKLAYYDTAVLVIDGVPVINDIYRNDLFQWSTLNKNPNIHISLKDVYYSIDYEALGIKPIPINIAIRLNLGDGLTPTPSRESYITNDKVKALLINKIDSIADWFVDKYNDTVGNFPDFLSAYNFIGNTTYIVNLGNNSFQINPILKYSTKTCQSPKIKGISMKDPLFYTRRKESLIREFTFAGYMDSNKKIRTKQTHIDLSYQLFSGKKDMILVSQSFVGNVREFLKSKYKGDTIFIKRNNFKRELGGEMDNKRNVGISTPDSYYNLLELRRFPKKDWRSHIKEWDFVVSTIVSTFIDETNVESSKAFTDWVQKKYDEQKIKRAANQISGSYNGLNKQQGDVTIAYSYERYGKVHFKKAPFPIAKLTENKFATVIVAEEDEDKAKSIIKLNKCNNIKFAMIGKLEMKKLPKSHQFITFNQYLSMESKPFMRLASAILYKRATKEFDSLTNHKNGIYKLCIEHLLVDVETLEDYIDRNLVYTGDSAVETIILETAEENKLFDLKNHDIYNRVREGIKKYDFVSLLKEPSYYDTEHQKRYNSLINQILLFRKKYYNDLEGAEIVFKK